jgi:hypothetical protein
MHALLMPVWDIRRATPEDMPAVMAMRERNERAYVGAVEVPVNVAWLVVTKYDRVVACAGVSYAGERRLIVTDLYHDGTYTGKRGLAKLLRDGLAARANIFVSVPFDRPDLRDALERRGIVFNAWNGEYRP